jgi:segregation and condensation protein B
MTGAAKNTNAKPGASEPEAFDRELAGMPKDLRWREWMGRIEAVLFASSRPVEEKELARIIGQGASVEALIADIQTEVAERPFELVKTPQGWMFRTRKKFANAIKAVADLGPQVQSYSESEMGVLCAIAYHQPIDRAGLRDIFGKEISRDLLGRLREQDLIALGPRAPRAGAPHTFVTTKTFLTTFDLASLRDLPEMELRAL